MKKFFSAAAALGALAAAVLAFAPGCESSESNDVTVSPGHATVSRGGSVSFAASGWDNFRWSLSDGSLGVLSATVGKSVVYTATASGEGTQRVTATAIGSGASSTNAVGYSGTAVVTHK
ncbi:MAG: hypothetical protein IJV65_02135 [Kiritimatiellae bacterium]|nr:hypothetical protein [Kiritimatiellia bacterium]